MRIACLVLFPLFVHGAVPLPAGVAFHQGSANVVVIGGKTAIYGIPPGTPQLRRVFLTHARRDAVRLSVPVRGTHPAFVVPAQERTLFENPASFWSSLETGRFHDYAQQSTKVPVAPVSVSQAVSDGDTVSEGNVPIRVAATPGYTPGAVSYLIEAGGRRIACTGDLIYGDGKLFDLYSLQDAVPAAKARGYHGYAARAGDLIQSLRKVAAMKPDLILPVRGPAITDPQASIERLISRLQTFLASHFETDALLWYWGPDNHRVRSAAAGRPLNVMPMAETGKLPDDIVAIGNSRLLKSRSGAAFLVDAGYRNLMPELQKLRAAGSIRNVEGIWITHYHDDHTDYVNDVVKEFSAPVYFTDFMTEVLRSPGSFRLPCLTTRPIPVQNARADGATLRWHEWELTFLYFPGQTLYHGGLVAKRDGQTFLFAGDSFTPSGMDDYCMQNRDFLRSGAGYEYCLRKIAALPRNTWVINQHVEPMFRYSEAQIGRMQSEIAKRSAALGDLSPWPAINYMLDESWARVYPYGSEVQAGSVVDLEPRILNHSPGRQTYQVKWNLPAGWSRLSGQDSVGITGQKEGSLRARIRAGAAGLAVITADIRFAGHDLKQWTEALIRVR